MSNCMNCTSLPHKACKLLVIQQSILLICQYPTYTDIATNHLSRRHLAGNDSRWAVWVSRRTLYLWGACIYYQAPMGWQVTCDESHLWIELHALCNPVTGDTCLYIISLLDLSASQVSTGQPLAQKVYFYKVEFLMVNLLQNPYKVWDFLIVNLLQNPY